MIKYVYKWNGERYVRVPKPCDGKRVIELPAAQVRGTDRVLYSTALGSRMRLSLQDYHQPASGSGRTTSKRRGLSK